MAEFLPASKTNWGVRCPQVTFTIRGRWWRIFAGVTHRTKRFRWRRFYGYRLFVVRLYGQRVIGIQTRGSAGESG